MFFLKSIDRFVLSMLLYPERLITCYFFFSLNVNLSERNLSIVNVAKSPYPFSNRFDFDTSYSVRLPSS
jgi:hypothetical protein